MATSATSEPTTFPVLLCVDAEPDERRVDPVRQVDWLGFEGAFELIDLLRPLMESTTGRPVHLTWFLRMDPQVTHVYGDPTWAATRYRPQLDRLLANGDELGIHLHPWQWDAARAVWIQNFADQSWIDHCVAVAFGAFQQAFGVGCKAFRFGDRWMNNETMALIERLGATSDSTIEPGHVGTETPDEYIGTFPDYSGVPSYAYRPSRIDFQSPVPAPARDVLIVPINSAPATWASTPPLGTAASNADHREFEGRLDVTSTVEIAGWVWDRNDPDGRFDVEVWCDGALLATVGATHHREDLSCAGKGDGRHAFRLATPTHLKDGQTHVVSARVVGSDFDLAGGPSQLQGTLDPDAETITLYLDQHPFTFGLLVDRVLAEPATAVLTLKARSDFGRDQQRNWNVRSNIEHLLAHPAAASFSFITMSEFVQLNS